MLNISSISMFLNKLIFRGLKLKAFHFIWLVLIELKFRLSKSPAQILVSLLIEYLPWFRLLPKHLAGKKYLIPVQIKFSKSVRDFWKFIMRSAKQRLESTYPLRVLGEILDTYNGRSNTIKSFEERHILVYENRQNYRLLFT